MTNLSINNATRVSLPQPFIGRHLIDGQWVDSSETFERASPSHVQVVSVNAMGGEAETQQAIAAARRAFDSGIWNRITGKERAAILLRVAELIEANVERIALQETLESGKPVTQSRAEVSGAADLWRYAAALARTTHGDSHDTLGDDMLGMVLKQAIGVVSIITP
ncbi:MAG: aldehyde dehydrogenase family protein [Pseudomonadota bacterium]